MTAAEDYLTGLRANATPNQLPLCSPAVTASHLTHGLLFLCYQAGKVAGASPRIIITNNKLTSEHLFCIVQLCLCVLVQLFLNPTGTITIVYCARMSNVFIFIRIQDGCDLCQLVSLRMYLYCNINLNMTCLEQGQVDELLPQNSNDS